MVTLETANNALKEVYLVNRCLYSNISLFDEVDKNNYSLYSKYKYLVYNILHCYEEKQREYGDTVFIQVE